jgi:CheY-like chemotaxis protein
MSESYNWRLLVVDDDDDICANIKEFLESEHINNIGLSVETITDFSQALQVLEAQRIDLIILDVRMGDYTIIQDEEVGRVTLESIKARRFVPVIFYTGLPNLVEHFRSDLIQIVTKGSDGLESLLQAVKEIFQSRLPTINRALIRHIEEVQRRYMWDFVAQNWPELGEINDQSELAHLLARRLAISLSVDEIQALETELSGMLNHSKTETDVVHPITYYIIPPLSKFPQPGDLYLKIIKNISSYWVVLNPACDFVVHKDKCKVEHILLAATNKLSQSPEFTSWFNDQKRENRSKLEKLIRDNREGGQPDRYFFLPGVLNIPDLIIDLQRIESINYDDFKSQEWDRVASLDSPHAEAFQSKFSRYFGRIGKPDLNSEIIFSRFVETSPNTEDGLTDS